MLLIYGLEAKPFQQAIMLLNCLETYQVRNQSHMSALTTIWLSPFPLTEAPKKEALVEAGIQVSVSRCNCCHLSH